MTMYQYKAPTEKEIMAAQALAHRMRAEAMSKGLRRIASWVRGLFAGAAGAPAHR